MVRAGVEKELHSGHRGKGWRSSRKAAKTCALRHGQVAVDIG
jgi:hypothetical protein